MESKTKKRTKIAIDIIMVISFAFTYLSLICPVRLVHEIAGLITLPLIITHLVLNGHWIRAITANIFRGKIKHKKTVFKYIIFILLLITFIAALVTGVLIASFVIREGITFDAHRGHTIPSILFSVILGAHIIVRIPFKKMRKADCK